MRLVMMNAITGATNTATRMNSVTALSDKWNWVERMSLPPASQNIA